MKKLSALILLPLLVSTVLAETPTQTLEAYKKAAKKQDFDTAWDLAPRFDDSSDRITVYLKDKVQRTLEIFGSGWDLEILDEHIEGDCAVLVLNEKKPGKPDSVDIDPGYLIRQNGKWKVLPDISDFDIIEHVDKPKLEDFGKLAKWYQERKTTLKKERSGGYKPEISNPITPRVD